MATQIIYNGTVIGTVDAGQSKILKCNGKKMKSDVEIRAGERTEIKFDGAVIATVEAGDSKTIKCAGKTMKSNIEIRVEDDTPGKDGVSPTVEMIDIEGGTRIIITDVNGPKSADIMDGKDGPKGDKGDPGEKGENGAQGPKGDKGDKGDTGAQGIQGIQGEKGADGAKGDKGDKGDPGADGKTPVKGVDYYTEADKSEFSEYIASELAKRGQLAPEYAESLEWLDANGDQSKMYVLPDGFIYAWMLTEVESGPSYKNLADPTSSNWMADKRFSSTSGSISDLTGAFVSNKITAKVGDVVRMKGIASGSGSLASAYFGLMAYSDSAGTTKVFSNPMQFTRTQSQHAAGVKDIVTVENGITTYILYQLPGPSGSPVQREGSSSAVNFRVSGVPETAVDDIIITVNEEITENGGTTVSYAWANTGLAFVPADYEDRIIDLEEASAEHTKQIVALEKAVESGSTDETEAAALTRIKEWDKPVYDNAEVTLISENRSKPALTTSDRTIDAIYAKYRALMAAHPNYITETNMGKSASSNTFTAVDMLRFDFKESDGLTQPDLGESALHETKPKLIFMSGIHTEWVGVWGLYYALEEIATNPEFDDIRRNAHIIVIPCANPFCLTSQTAIEGWRMSHVNANGVAIHNNFNVDHSASGAVGEYNYGGSAPCSELETQYIDKVMAENPDAVAFVSCHNNDYSTYYGSHVIWASSATYHMCNMAFRLVDKLSKAWLNKYGDTLKNAIDQYKVNMDADDYRLGRATMSSSKGTEQKNATKYGIQGVNLEISRMMKVFSGNTDGSSEVMTHGAEVYANFMRTLLAAYDHKDKKEYAPNLPWSE